MRNSSGGAFEWTKGALARAVLSLSVLWLGGACASNGSGGAGGAAGADSSVGGGGTGTAGGAGGGIAKGGSSGTTGGGPAAGAAGNSGAGTGGAGAGGAGAGGAGSGAGGSAGVSAGAGGAGAAGSGGAAMAGSAGAGSGGGGPVDTVTRSESTYTFQHYPIETNASSVWTGAMTPASQPTSTTLDTVILENGYLRVTLLPSWGGRILSIVHKPTARELLYQNPVGTPYLMYEDIFYYDYLMILGGIFPSFPEPEHGKYWNQPYQFEVVSESPEAITVRMSRQDDRDIVEGIPPNYDVGRTDVLVELDVTLRAGRTNLELVTKLTNTRTTAVPEFEYWTVTTLAPGSTPGETSIPLDTHILAKMDQVHLLESSWSWFGSAEERVSGEVFRWNNLANFANWADQGTGFANPDYRANWSGLINYENDMGVLRVSENVATPGLKLWTFGRQSLDVDLTDSTQWLRPTIEMWHGITPEFWDRATLAAGEVRTWSESYLPTLGLREVTAASDYGAVHLSQSQSGTDTVLDVTATLTVPAQSVHAVLRLDDRVIEELDVVVNPAEPTELRTTVPSNEAPSGASFEVEFSQAQTSLLSGQITLP
jgi:hypothetical protein